MNNPSQTMRRGGAWSGYYLRKDQPVWACGAYLSRKDAERMLQKIQKLWHFTTFLCKGEDWQHPLKAFHGDLTLIRSEHVKQMLAKCGINT